MSASIPANQEPRTPPTDAAQAGHAPEGTEVPVVYVTAAALFTLILLSLLAVWLLTRLFAAWLPSAAGSLQRWDQPAPELVGQPPAGQVRRRLEQRSAALLSSYVWLGEDHDVARIPIDRAMHLLVADPSLIGPVNGPPPQAQRPEHPEELPEGESP